MISTASAAQRPSTKRRGSGAHAPDAEPRTDFVPDASGSDLDSLVDAQRLRSVFAHSFGTTALSMVYAAWITLYVHPRLGSIALVWFGLKMLTAAPRIGAVIVYRRLSFPYSRAWVNWTIGLAALDGLAWGMAGIWLMPHDDYQTMAAVGASLLGICAISTFGLFPDWRINLAYSVPVILPSTITLALRGDTFGQFSAVGQLGFCVVLAMAAHRSQGRLVELLRLRYTMSEAKRQAEVSEEAKTRFLATMSHEMRTPLHGLLGLARLLKHDVAAQPSQVRHCDLILGSGEHLLRLINDLLDMSKIQSGNGAINPQPFKLREAVQDVLMLSDINAGQAGLTLKTDLAVLDEHQMVFGDPLRLRQILHNLIGNAIKFTEHGSVMVSVWRPRDHSGDGATVRFLIEDTGIGIAAEDLPRLFEAFRQVDGSFARRFAGTGLGLSVSRAMARAMGGDIECSSVLGQGSAFVLTLPLPIVEHHESSSDHGVAAGNLSGSDHVVDPAGVPLRGTVLLAEDNDVSALVGEAVLRSLGLDVECVRNGQAAIDAMARHPRPDLILMDCQMPDVDGFEATRQIRADERRRGAKHVPIVALTANAFAEDRERCLAAGMDDHLAKPFDDQDLVGVLRRHLRVDAEAL